MKRVWILSSCCAILFLEGACQSSRDVKSSLPNALLGVELRTDRNAYAIGETVRLDCILTNRSARAYRILRRGGLLDTEWIHIVREDGTPAEDIWLAIVDPVRTGPEDYITLDPGQSFTNVITGLVLEGTVFDVGRHEHKGLYISFDACAIVLVHPGTFRIFAVYEVTSGQADDGRKRFGYQHVFTGSVTSDWVRVTIGR